MKRIKFKTRLIKHKSLISLSLMALFFASCSVPKDVAYFQDVQQETIIVPATGELKILPEDKLSIVVKTMDEQLSSLFNLTVITDRTGEGAGPSGLSKYTVNKEGTIDFPLLGKIKVEGMTRDELAGFIKGELMGRNLAKDPIVTVEFVNAGFSVLGEVRDPGRYDISKEHLTIIDAISMAGDLNLQGKRENIALLRNTDGETQTYRVDLTNFKELANSPAYYIQQGDIIYVEPNDMRKRQTTTNGNNIYSTSFWLSVASLLTSVVTTVGVFVVK